MSDDPGASERRPRRQTSREQPPAVAQSGHSIQESGHQPADSAPDEPREESRGRSARRQPGPVEEET